jgi:hypothetical protein
MTLSLINPVPGAVITGGFGDWYVDSQRRSYQHRGLDLAAPAGTPIIAPCDGLVVSFTNDGSFGAFAICIWHEASGLYVLLAHGRVSSVVPGQRVRQGQQIGEVGNLGTSSGNHCHLQVCTSPAFPVDISYSRDPLSFMEEIDMDRLERLERLLVGNGFDAICYPGTEELFPPGTLAVPEGTAGPRVRLTGENALRYCDLRGFSFGLALEMNQAADAARGG